MEKRKKTDIENFTLVIYRTALKYFSKSVRLRSCFFAYSSFNDVAPE